MLKIQNMIQTLTGVTTNNADLQTHKYTCQDAGNAFILGQTGKWEDQLCREARMVSLRAGSWSDRDASLRIATRVLRWAKRAIANWRTFGISTLLKKGTKEPPLDIVKLTNKFFTAAWGKITMRAWYFIPRTVKNPIIAIAVRSAPAVFWEFYITPASFWTKTPRPRREIKKPSSSTYLPFHIPVLLVSVWNGVSCHNGTRCPPKPQRRISRPASLPWTPVC